VNRVSYIFILIFLAGSFSWAAPAKRRPNTSESISPSRPELFPMELTGTFSVINPSRLVLSSREYQVSYSKNLLGFSAFQMGLGVPLKQWGNFQFSTLTRLGYAKNQGTYSLTAMDGAKSQSEVSLHWVPLSGGIKTEYAIPSFDLIRPYLAISGGAEWLHQSGELQGIAENFWIPFYNVSLGLSFLDKPEADTWFGGFSFSMSFQNGLKPEQQVRTLSYDLTAHFFL